MYVVKRERGMGGGYIAHDTYRSNYCKYLKYAKQFNSTQDAENSRYDDSEIVIDMDNIKKKKSRREVF